MSYDQNVFSAHDNDPSEVSNDTLPIAPGQRADKASLEVIYRRLLKRLPDPEVLAQLTQEATNGSSCLDICRKILSTDEWQNIDATEQEQRLKHPLLRLCRAHLKMADITWFHSVQLPDGTVTPGRRPPEILKAEADCVFSQSVVGKSVLDIGAWDGYFSFEAEKRGAASVHSTDHFCWSGPGWGTDAGYQLLHHTLQSSATFQDLDVFDLDPESQGQFDVVLFLGVLYHLKDPYGGLEKAASMCRDLLIVETETTHNFSDIPLMRYYLGREMNNDPTNYWAPNLACLRAMLNELGFSRVEFTPRSMKWAKHTELDGDKRFRYTVHARRS